MDKAGECIFRASGGTNFEIFPLSTNPWGLLGFDLCTGVPQKFFYILHWRHYFLFSNILECPNISEYLYPDMPKEEGLTLLKRFLNARTENKVTTETLVVLAEIDLKNAIFQGSEKTLKQMWSTEICTKFAPLYAILPIADLEGSILEEIELHMHGGGILMVCFYLVMWRRFFKVCVWYIFASLFFKSKREHLSN